MGQLFWLGVRGGSLQLPSFSCFVKYEATLELEPGLFQAYLITLKTAQVPTKIPLAQVSSAIRYLHFVPKHTFWKDKTSRPRRRRRPTEGSDGEEEEEEDAEADANIATAQSDVLLNRFELAADDPQGSRPGRLVSIMGKPFIDKNVRMELEDVRLLMQQIKDQIRARTGQEKGPYFASCEDDVGTLTGHPTLCFKCSVIFNGLFCELPINIRLLLEHPQNVKPYQLDKLLAAWNADPNLKKMVRFCGKYLSAGGAFAADADICTASATVYEVFKMRRAREKQSFFSSAMRDSLCNIHELIQTEVSEGWPGVLLPHQDSESTPHIAELQRLLSPPVDEQCVCAWWSADVTAFIQIRQQFGTNLRAMSMPTGFDDMLTEQEVQQQQRSENTLYVCESVRHMHRLQEMSVLCCQGLWEHGATDTIRASSAFHAALRNITRVYLLDAHTTSIGRGLKTLRTLADVCPSATYTVCFDPYLLGLEHRSIKLAHAVASREDTQTLRPADPSPVIQPQREALAHAIDELTDTATVIAFAAVAQQMRERLSMQRPSLLVVPKPTNCSYWLRAFQGRLPLNLLTAGRIIWSPSKNTFGCIVKLHNAHGSGADSTDRWRIPGSMPVSASISFQGNLKRGGVANGSCEDETLTADHVATNELTHSYNPKVMHAPVLFLLRTSQGIDGGYYAPFLYRVYCALRSGALTQVVWVESPP